MLFTYSYSVISFHYVRCFIKLYSFLDALLRTKMLYLQSETRNWYYKVLSVSQSALPMHTREPVRFCFFILVPHRSVTAVRGDKEVGEEEDKSRHAMFTRNFKIKDFIDCLKKDSSTNSRQVLFLFFFYYYWLRSCRGLYFHC